MAYPQRSHYIQVAQQGVTLLILLLELDKREM